MLFGLVEFTLKNNSVYNNYFRSSQFILIANVILFFLSGSNINEQCQTGKPKIFIRNPVCSQAFTNSNIFQEAKILQAKSLNVGDSVPGVPLTIINPAGVLHVGNLKEFSGKHLILDFWATWCGSCVSHLPILDSLQQIYKDELQILLINSVNTGDSFEKVMAFFKKQSSNGNCIHLLSAVNDSGCLELFPHVFLPHYIWITPGGRVAAITSSSYVIKENVEKFIHSDSLEIEVKSDFLSSASINPTNNIVFNRNSKEYSYFKKGKLGNYNAIEGFRHLKDDTGEDVVVGIGLRNKPLLDIYKMALLFDTANGFAYSDKRFFVDVKDSSKLFFSSSKLSKDQWEVDNLYTYDFAIPVKKKDSLFKLMLEDLNCQSNYYGRFEKKKIQCYALVPYPKCRKYSSDENLKDDIHTYQMPVKKLIARINNLKAVKYLVINELGYSGLVNFRFPESNSIDDVLDLVKVLKKYHLDLEKKESEILVFILGER